MSPEGQMHAAHQDGMICETKFFLSSCRFFVSKRDSSYQGFRICSASFHGNSIRGGWILFLPGRAKNLFNDGLHFLGLINADTIIGDNKMQSKEGIHNAKSVDVPLLFENVNNCLIGGFMFAGTKEEIICGSSNND
jgi:hypothetical protein